MARVNLIGLIGKAGAGKDTAARMIATRHLVTLRGRVVDLRAACGVAEDPWPLCLGAVQIAFADPLKAFCHEVYGWSVPTLWGDSAARGTIDPRTGLSPRTVLQLIGTDGFRRLHPDTWVALGIRRAADLRGAGAGVVVVSDCRFVNEARAMVQAGGRLVYLRRGQGLGGAAGAHASEQLPAELMDLAQVHGALVSNEGSVDDLRAKLRTVLSVWGCLG